MIQSGLHAFFIMLKNNTETVPANAILTEDGEPILTEDGDYILFEDA